MNMFRNMRREERLLAGLVTTGAVEAAWGGFLWWGLGGDEGFAWFAITGQFIGVLAFTVSMAFLAARSGPRGLRRAPQPLRRAGLRPLGSGPRTSRGD
jgi:hypothetical protein